jgi:hypothetical protein
MEEKERGNCFNMKGMEEGRRRNTTRQTNKRDRTAIREKGGKKIKV